MSLLSGPSVPIPKVSYALRKRREEEEKETVGWSLRRKCPFNQTCAQIALPSPLREGGQHVDRWTDIHRKIWEMYSRLHSIQDGQMRAKFHWRHVLNCSMKHEHTTHVPFYRLTIIDCTVQWQVSVELPESPPDIPPHEEINNM